MTYPIESHIPYVETERRDYPFDRMSVGQSFMVPYIDGPDKQTVQRRVATVVYRQHQKDDGRRYSWKTVTEGIRVWRVA